jgi:O-acetyl-ADP-ribose deacetylase (regulator of RNase III)
MLFQERTDIMPFKTIHGDITKQKTDAIVNTVNTSLRAGGGGHGEEKLLRYTYTNALKCAVENGCKSVAFSLISSGIYGYPKDEALKIATSAIQEFITDHDIDITHVLFDK